MKANRVTPIFESNYIPPAAGFGDGGYGMAMQRAYDKRGIETNYGPGNDIPDLELEIKTWDKTKKGHISVASSTADDIIVDDGAVFLEKFKKWNLHTHEAGVFHPVRKIDFGPIQDVLEEELADLADQLLKGSNAPKSEHLILEKVKSNSWKLRIKFNKAENLFGMTKSRQQLNDLFGEF
tara:strand:+ start:49 stop:588 length:540 start_codon:yes stop_codon:yes gene_type:complete